MEKIVLLLEKLQAMGQKAINSLRADRFLVIIAGLIAWGSSGWLIYFEERDDHKKDNRHDAAIKETMANGLVESKTETIHAQGKQIETMEKLIKALTSKDTAK
jgi:hypothetical protein